MDVEEDGGRRQTQEGFTLLELMVVLFLIGGLALYTLAYVNRPRRLGNTIKCVSNLKNVGLAFRIFATDNNDMFPTEVSTNAAGSKEFNLDSANIYRHFQALSNELSTPKIVLCPQDSFRTEATDFSEQSAGFSAVPFNSNRCISYFVGINASEREPDSVLSGDRNLLLPGRRGLDSCVVTVSPGSQTGIRRLSWSRHLHRGKGNLAFGDGSVRQVAVSGLQQVFQTTVRTNVLALPGY